MLKVLCLRGLPASGKSTFARELMAQHQGHYVRTNKDDIRAMLHGGHWSKNNEKMVLKLRDQIILDALADGKHVIVDDTNFAPKHITRIKELVLGLANVEIKDFEITLEEAIRRDSKRERRVGKKVITDMYNQFVRKEVEPIEYIDGLPSLVICDIDGTVARMADRSPYDLSKVHLDTVIEQTFRLLHAYSATGINIIMLSGREDSCRDVTQEWLSDNHIPHADLLMRKAGDNRKDSIVKKEIYEAEIKGKFNVIAVIDDRLQVCRMWHEEGLPLFRVGDPDADF